MTFREKLKKAMYELDLNQVQVARLTGKSKGSVSMYLNDKTVPPESVQSEIAMSLGLDADYFSRDDELAAIRQSDDVRKLDVETAATLLQMNHNTVRKGLQQGVFPWGYAIKTSDHRWTYFINAKRFAEIEGIRI